jgi:Glycosyl transferase family 2
MADGVHPVHGGRRHPGPTEVGPDKLGALPYPGRVAVNDADLVTGVPEGFDHMRPDEPASPSDQDPHLAPPIEVIDVILPVLDERAALPRVLASIPAGYRAIVVDNGSTDGSGELAAGLGATVVEEPQRGFGAACFAGLVAAGADVVCFMDCDGSLDGADLPKVAAPVVEGRADLVMGRRRAAKGSWPVHARVANLAVGAALRARHRVRVRDIGPMRAARRAALLELGIVDRRFGWPLEMVVRAADRGWRIAEVDVPYHPRLGRSKVTGTVKGTVKTVRDMAAVLR